MGVLKSKSHIAVLLFMTWTAWVMCLTLDVADKFWPQRWKFNKKMTRGKRSSWTYCPHLRNMFVYEMFIICLFIISLIYLLKATFPKHAEPSSSCTQEPGKPRHPLNVGLVFFSAQTFSNDFDWTKFSIWTNCFFLLLLIFVWNK